MSDNDLETPQLSRSVLREQYRQVRRHKHLEGECRIDEWIERLRFIAEHDRVVDQQMKWAQRTMIFGFFGIVFSFIFGFFTVMSLLIFIVPISGIIFLVLRNIDVPNRIKDLSLADAHHLERGR